MSMFDTKTNPAICVLPWVHEYKTIGSDVGPCCYGDKLENDETIESIRQDMLKGIQPKACANCYVKEAESGWSPRIHETIDWIKKFGEPDTLHPILESVDVRYDPTCNLKCKTCGPYESTLWQKEKKVFMPIIESNKIYLENVSKKDLKKIYLAGGEPTYIKGYLSFLKQLYEDNPKCEVVINTNLKKIPDKWKDIIRKFDNLTIVCSCDATELLGRYVRYPLGWDEFEDNVKFVAENVNFLQFNLVASNLTSHKLFETCTWMKRYSKNINIHILETPECFSESAVPLQYRSVYTDNIKKLSKFPVSVHYAMNFRKKIDYLLQKYRKSSYEPSLHASLRMEIASQDRHRTLKLQDVDPFLYNWVYE